MSRLGRILGEESAGHGLTAILASTALYVAASTSVVIALCWALSIVAKVQHGLSISAVSPPEFVDWSTPAQDLLPSRPQPPVLRPIKPPVLRPNRPPIPGFLKELLTQQDRLDARGFSGKSYVSASSLMSRAIYYPDPNPKVLAQTKTEKNRPMRGKTSVAFCVDHTGRTRDIRTTRRFPNDAEIDRICRAAVARWRFVPRSPHKVSCTTVTFHLIFEPARDRKDALGTID